MLPARFETSIPLLRAVHTHGLYMTPGYIVKTSSL